MLDISERALGRGVQSGEGADAGTRRPGEGRMERGGEGEHGRLGAWAIGRNLVSSFWFWLLVQTLLYARHQTLDTRH